jgi:hypothetical protein
LALSLLAGGNTGTPGVEPAAPNSPVRSIRVLPADRMIGVLGTRIEMGAAALMADGSMTYGSTFDPIRFSWSSSAPEAVSIDEDRIVAGLSEGTATITATSGGVSGRTTVTVADRVRLAWSVALGTGWVGAAIIIGPDGGQLRRLFARSRGGWKHLRGECRWDPVCVHRGGALRWAHATGDVLRSSPAFGSRLDCRSRRSVLDR